MKKQKENNLKRSETTDKREEESSWKRELCWLIVVSNCKLIVDPKFQTKKKNFPISDSEEIN